MFKKKIPAQEAKKVIEDNNLKLYNNIWHYSFNDVFFVNDFNLVKNKNGSIYLYTKPLNHWSPTPLFANFSNPLLKIKNIIKGEYDSEKRDNRKIFWFLKIESLDSFLERRTKLSSKPHKHFPSTKTYEKVKNKINGTFKIFPFNEVFFIENFNKLKPNRVPKNWTET